MVYHLLFLSVALAAAAAVLAPQAIGPAVVVAGSCALAALLLEDDAPQDEEA